MHFSLDISINKDRCASTIPLLLRLFPIVLFEIILCGAKLLQSANIIFL